MSTSFKFTRPYIPATLNPKETYVKGKRFLFMRAYKVIAIKKQLRGCVYQINN